MLPKEGVNWTFVIEGEDKVVTDFFSMYRLDQSCTNKEANDLGHFMMRSGCLYYYGLTNNSIVDITKLCLWISKEDMDCDAFSVMTVMDNNPEMLRSELGFLAGDGALHWYLVNWSLGKKNVTENEIGTILI